MITVEENTINRDNVMKNWRLGPLRASVQPTDNKEYWSMMAIVWSVPEEDARCMLCANCEYYDNSFNMLKEMNVIPLDEFDLDGGGRGFCEKFDFICHNLRTCQAWEDKSYMDDAVEEAMKAVLPDVIKGLYESK